MQHYKDILSTHSVSITGLLGLTLVCFVLFGCSDNGEEPNPPPGNNGELDAGTDTDVGDPIPDAETDAETDTDADAGTDPDADAGTDPDADAGTDPDADTGTDPDADVENGEEDPSPENPLEDTGPCGTMYDIGQLEFGEATLEVDFDDFDDTDDLNTVCDEGSEENDMALIKFASPQPQTGILELNADADVALEIRPGAICSNESLSNICEEDGSLEKLIGPGSIHFILIEHLGEEELSAPLQVDFSFYEMPECDWEDEGTGSCVDSDTAIEACQVLSASADIPREFTVPCPTHECIDDHCVGDHCDQAIAVTSSFGWSGRNKGFFPTHNILEEHEAAADAGEDPTCVDTTVDEADQFPETFGREMIFELEDLQEGDEVEIHVNAEMSDGLMVLVKEECSSTSSCTEAWQDKTDMTFEAPDDGSYYVIVDTLWDIDSHFEIAIDILE